MTDLNFMDHLVVAYVAEMDTVRLLFEKAAPINMKVNDWFSKPLPSGVVKPPLGTRFVAEDGTVGGSVMAYREGTPLPIAMQFPDGTIRPAS